MASFTPHLRKRISKWAVFNKNYGDGGGNGAEKFEVKPGEHYWKNFEDEHKAQAAKEKGVADYLNFNKEEHEHAIVAVGTTGTGKSSIVKLFCGEDVGVSHETTSKTKHAELFEEKGDDAVSNRKWMDTQGTDDSDMDDTDEKILKKIFKKLWLKKIHFITVLWLISGDFDRQKGEYLRQAQFIQSLQTEQSQSNIWKSVLMIQKMGTLQPKWTKIRGIIDAAKNNGAKMVYLDEDSVKDHIVGFKCIELIEMRGEDPMYEALCEAETPKEKLVQLGYVNQKEMKSILMERLKKIDCFMLDYQDKICEKCSLRGDPRYLYYKCHWLPKPHHPGKLVPYHPKELEQYHPLDTHVIHPGKVVHIHPKGLEDYHPEELIEMEVDDTDNPVFDHPGEYITIITGKLCCTKETQKWNCCQKEARYAKGCRKQFPKKTIITYPCCKKKKDKEKDEEEKGCDEEFHGGCQRRYLCCQKKEGSDPCVSKYDCCEKPPNSEGCATVWKCCEFAEDSPGCKERYMCCQMPDGSRGCQDKWDCCEQAPEEQGCQTVCSRCGVKWGHKPGCSWPENPDDDAKSPDVVDEDGNVVIDEMHTNDYDEAHNPTIAEEVEEERKAAIEAELTPVPPLGFIPTGTERDAANMSNEELL
eukprot:CAMPEP_0201575122 /NCGR_PEP_ID=MMETSP0190_2-20130828/20115_1 /ASSEMBLY_ACC=CAM_ASM_000263 /TAXON_ID=37353 /ORGANISM="Rosalina sp." /LENGTH=640 /DNA_ID=CAMNT_0048004347 /DNA_START=135 /DNA_END=2057 /DNA_ORIENTATION=-